MAKENYVSLIAQVLKEPAIVNDQTTGLPCRARIKLMTIKRELYDNAGSYSPSFDYPLVETSDPEMIKAITELQQYDMIDVKGTFGTKNILRRTKCPHCSEPTLTQGVMDYIQPTFIYMRERGLSRNEGQDYLKRCAEASNIVKIIGKVCKEPNFWRSADSGLMTANYCLAVNRKLFNPAEPDITADFPWIKTYGKDAEEDEKAIQEGSRLFVDGYIKTENATQDVRCDSCGKTYQFKNVAMIVRPFSIEYLEDCYPAKPRDSFDNR